MRECVVHDSMPAQKEVSYIQIQTWCNDCFGKHPSDMSRLVCKVDTTAEGRSYVHTAAVSAAANAKEANIALWFLTLPV